MIHFSLLHGVTPPNPSPLSPSFPNTKAWIEPLLQLRRPSGWCRGRTAVVTAGSQQQRACCNRSGCRTIRAWLTQGLLHGAGGAGQGVAGLLPPSIFHSTSRGQSLHPGCPLTGWRESIGGPDMAHRLYFTHPWFNVEECLKTCKRGKLTRTDDYPWNFMRHSGHGQIW